jgi:hypothetical protein
MINKLAHYTIIDKPGASGMRDVYWVEGHRSWPARSGRCIGGTEEAEKRIAGLREMEDK